MSGHGQISVGSECTLLHALYPRNSKSCQHRAITYASYHLASYHPCKLSCNSLPDDNVLSGDVFGLSNGDLRVHLGSVERRGDLDDSVVGIEFRVEVGLEVDGVLDTRLCGLSDMCLKTEGEVDVGC
jgi:hypothetical protein